MITFKLDNDCLITLRTSGTEPKIKYYSEMKGDDYENTVQRLKLIVDDMVNVCLRPTLNNLV